MSDAMLMKYAIGLAIGVLCLLAALGIKIRLRHVSRLSRKILYHALGTACLCGAVLVAWQYAGYAAIDLKLPAIADRVINIAAVAAIVVVVALQLFLLIDLLEKRQIKKTNDATRARLTSRLLKIVVTMFFVLLFADRLGMSLSGLLAFGGVGGIAIGMASKDILSNFLSGFMLFYDKEFDIGDWISSPDRNIQGTVVEIGWRITKIMTFDHRPLYVPNSLFSSISVENPGRMTNRRIKTSVGLRYEDAAKIRAVVADIRAMLHQDEKIDQTKTILVYFDGFGDSSLNVLVYCFTKTTIWAEWLEAQQDVYLNIIDIVHAHGADIAFQTQTLYVEGVEGDAGAGTDTPGTPQEIALPGPAGSGLERPTSSGVAV